MKKKIKSIGLYVLVFILMSSLSGCLDIYFTTEITAKGEIIKTIVFEGDSTEILDIYLPVIHNDTWEKQWVAGEDDKSKLVLKKTFKNDKEAVHDLNPADSTPTTRMEPRLKKRFRWFFTYFKYEEVVLATNPFDKLDWSNYLTQDEVELAVMDDDERESDPRYDEETYEGSTEERFEKYLITSAFEEFFDLFMLAMKNTTEIQLTPQEVVNHKDTLMFSIFEFDDNESAAEIIDIFCTVLETDDPKKIYQQNKETLDWFNLKIEYFENAFDDEMNFTVRMPGLLIDTNSKEIKGNNLTWQLDGFDAFFMDYKMTAESRIVNNWTFVVTGILLALLLFFLIFSLLRRKK